MKHARPAGITGRLATATLGSLLLAWTACGVPASPAAPPATPTAEPVVQPRILESVPHDPRAFTQGLLIDGEVWLESTGLYGRSELREVDRQTGKILRRRPLPRDFFGEGLALWNQRLYQLTWKAQTCLVYDRKTLVELQRFSYQGEGWGLTSDERWLYMSDGSATIRVMDPETFTETRSFEVHANAGPVRQLNELEWINGELWANIFNTKWIVRADPEDGRVLGFLNLQHLPLPAHRHARQDVLNGIAFDPAEGAIWVTGKNWKRLYRLAWPPP